MSRENIIDYDALYIELVFTRATLDIDMVLTKATLDIDMLLT